MSNEQTPVENAETLSTYKTELPCPLTDEERNRYGRRLAQLEQDIAQHKENTKSIMADQKAKEAALTAERASVAGKIRNGVEHRLITCTVTAWFDTNRVVTTRNDTKEVVEERAMRSEDRQIKADLKPEPVVTGAEKKVFGDLKLTKAGWEGKQPDYEAPPEPPPHDDNDAPEVNNDE